jgi:inner membrane protein
VLLLDAVQQARPWPVPVLGLLDEPAHVATAWLGLAALAPRVMPRRTWWVALAASVIIDVDHVPLYLTGGAFAVDGGRPPTHCLLTVSALLLLGATGSTSRWALGAAAGVLLHLLRDLATGPGVPLLWPYIEASARIPHAVYVAVLVALAVLAATRRPAAATVRTARDQTTRGLRRLKLRSRRKRIHTQVRTEQSDPRR